MTSNTQTISQIIEQMQKPDFYPHPVSTPIQLIQTHVSYVLLTGDYVYKLKKPVNFGFLDYSTLERRKGFCEAELTMNQDLAPGIYLEVLPLTNQGEQVALNGEGEPVEYALKMRQFPQEVLLSEMYQRGELTPGHIEELGRVVAQFHLNSTTSDYIRSFGEIPQIKAAFDENYQQTEKYIGTVQTAQQFEETKAYTEQFFAQRGELFAKRQENQKIRECHGDLHLRNMCLWQDKIALFDRIEFNEPFRFADVMYDVAFVVMDLEARGSRDLGNIFLNTYIEQTGDWEGLQLLPLYLSRQAYVRAKVTSFLLDDPGVDDAQKQEAAETAANYYRLAWEYTQINSGQLIIMSGLSGSGKTTVARKIAQNVGAIQIRSDAVRKHLAGIPVTQRGSQDLYSAVMNEKTYGRLGELGLMLAQEGFAVVLDAKYDRQDLRESVIEAALAQSIPFKIVHCSAPEEILRDRLTHRTEDVSDATASLITQQSAQAEPFTEQEQPYVTTVDTTQTNWESLLNSLHA